VWHRSAEVPVETRSGEESCCSKYIFFSRQPRGAIWWSETALASTGPPAATFIRALAGQRGDLRVRPRLPPH
jgi:hypothetical protein